MFGILDAEVFPLVVSGFWNRWSPLKMEMRRKTFLPKACEAPEPFPPQLQRVTEAGSLDIFWLRQAGFWTKGKWV